MRDHVSFPVVGLGGSAGGLQALMTFFENLPADTGMAYVVILHLSPNHESAAAQILQRATPMPVAQITATVAIEPDHVYVIPPHSDLRMEGGQLQVLSTQRPVGSAVAIDLFFRTLSHEHRELAFCVVLSGTGSDGATGLSDVKGEGGVTFAQAPEDAEWGDMPRAAIATGLVDIVLPVAQIGPRLVELAGHARRLHRGPLSLPEAVVEFAGTDRPMPAISLPAQGEKALRDILTTVFVQTRHDFRQYKPATVVRRIRRRLQINGLPDFESYRDHLRAEPAEMQPLLQDLLISVTGFFRDPEAFGVLETRVLPELIDALAPGEGARIWSAGCATGEEAYSLGMLLQESRDATAGPPAAPFQIFASDIDERAIRNARRGAYRSGIQADVSAARLDRFFAQEEDGGYRVLPVLRERVLFAAHNLLRDPPFSRIDLVCCRNLLIYLDAAAQASTLEMLHYALKPGGYLMLGATESIGTAEHLFTSIDAQSRIFRAVAQSRSRVRLPPMPADAPPPEVSVSKASSGRVQAINLPTRDDAAAAHLEAIAQVAPASVLVDDRRRVLHLSATAGRFMSYAGGPPSSSLLDNVDADLRLHLRTALFEAARTGACTRVQVTRSTRDAVPGTVDIVVHPLVPKRGAPARTLVVFEEVAEPDAVQASRRGRTQEVDDATLVLLLRSHAEIERLEHVLHETLEHSTLATEELGSANEELQAINEELRSAGEELETGKEELFSMNEELMRVNAELRARVEERGRLNDDLHNFVAASGIATVFVDAGLRVRRFTPQASTLFNLIASDVGRSLLDITNSFDYAGLADDATAVFRQLRPIERFIQATDGRHFMARIVPYRTADDTIDGAVLTFVDITRLRIAEERVRSSEERLRVVAASTQDYAILAMDDQGRVTAWNTGAQRLFGFTEAEMLGQPVDAIFTLEDQAAGIPAHELEVARNNGRTEDERWHRRKDGSTFYCSGVLMQVPGPDGAEYARIARDITGSKRHALAQENLLLSERQALFDARTANETKDRFLAIMSHELKQPLNLIHVQAELLTRRPETGVLEPVQRAATTIQRAVASQGRIIDDLLDLSRIRTDKLRLDPRPVELDDLVRGLVEAAGDDARRRGLVLELACEAGVRCVCDRVRVEQVVSNLLANALKFTPSGGTVSVRLVAEDGFARLTVADTGAGIAPHALSGIFEMFSQVDPRGMPDNTGLGIGLTLVRELVRAHGGSVEAVSEGAGCGARFIVRLPLDGPAAAVAAAG